VNENTISVQCKVQFLWGFSFHGFSGSLEISMVTRVLAVTRKWNVAVVFMYEIQYY
jgi:hypothetical protein